MRGDSPDVLCLRPRGKRSAVCPEPNREVRSLRLHALDVDPPPCRTTISLLIASQRPLTGFPDSRAFLPRQKGPNRCARSSTGIGAPPIWNRITACLSSRASSTAQAKLTSAPQGLALSQFMGKGERRSGCHRRGQSPTPSSLKEGDRRHLADEGCQEAITGHEPQAPKAIQVKAV
jgi:hypothetical protein